MQGQHELADLAPRDVVAKAITRRMLETGQPHMWLDARHLGRGVLGAALPDDPGDLPRARRRPGHRADPGRAGPATTPPAASATDLWGRSSVPGPLRHRRGRLLRRARRQPAGLQLPARGAGLLPPDRRGAARRAARRGPSRSPTTATDGLVDGDRRRELQDVMTDARRRAALRRRARRGRSTCSHAARAADGRAVGRRRLGDDQPAHHQHRPRRGRRAARGDPRLALARGLPRARRRAWAGHVDVAPRRRRRDRSVRPCRALDRPVRRRRRMTARRTTTLPGRPASPSSPTAGLDPSAVYADVVRALAEDLPDGADDVDQRRHDPRRRPRRGRLRGPRGRAWSPGWASPRWSSATCWATTSTITDRVARRHPRRGGRRGHARRRADPRPAHRRAHRAQLRLPPVRRRDRDRALGRRRSRAPTPGCSTPARRCPGCGPCRSTPCAAAAASTTGSACPTWRWSRTTTCIAAGGVVPAFEAVRAAVPRRARRGRGHRPRPARASCSTRAATGSCSTT